MELLDGGYRMNKHFFSVLLLSLIALLLSLVSHTETPKFLPSTAQAQNIPPAVLERSQQEAGPPTVFYFEDDPPTLFRFDE